MLQTKNVANIILCLFSTDLNSRYSVILEKLLSPYSCSDECYKARICLSMPSIQLVLSTAGIRFFFKPRICATKIPLKVKHIWTKLSWHCFCWGGKHLNVGLFVFILKPRCPIYGSSVWWNVESLTSLSCTCMRCELVLLNWGVTWCWY